MSEAPTGSLSFSRPRVLKNTVSQVLTIGLSMATGGIASIIVARALGASGLGVFMPAWQLAVSLSIVALLGVGQRMIRELNRGAGPEEVGSTLFLSCILGLLFGGAAAAAPALLGARPALTTAFAAAGAYVAISAPALVLRESFHARERMEVETGTLLVETVVALGCIPFALTFGDGAVWVIGALGMGRLVNLLVAGGLAHRMWGRLWTGIRPRRWPTVVKDSIPLGLSFSFTTMVLRFDMVLVGVLLPSEDAGIYSAAAILTFAIPIVVTSVNRSLFPVLSRAREMDHPELRPVFVEAWRTLLILGLTAAVGLVVLARPAITLVFGPDFGAAGPVLAALAWLLPVRFVNNLCATTLNATVWRRGQAVRFGTVILLNLVTNLLLIPVFGYWGAVYAALGAEILLLGVLLHAVRPLAPPLLGPLVEGGLIAAAVGAAAFWTPGHVLLRVAAGGLVFVVLGPGRRRLLSRRPEGLRSAPTRAGQSG